MHATRPWRRFGIGVGLVALILLSTTSPVYAAPGALEQLVGVPRAVVAALVGRLLDGDGQQRDSAAIWAQKGGPEIEPDGSPVKGGPEIEPDGSPVEGGSALPPDGVRADRNRECPVS